MNTTLDSILDSSNATTISVISSTRMIIPVSKPSLRYSFYCYLTVTSDSAFLIFKVTANPQVKFMHSKTANQPRLQLDEYKKLTTPKYASKNNPKLSWLEEATNLGKWGYIYNTRKGPPYPWVSAFLQVNNAYSKLIWQMACLPNYAITIVLMTSVCVFVYSFCKLRTFCINSVVVSP